MLVRRGLLRGLAGRCRLCAHSSPAPRLCRRRRDRGRSPIPSAAAAAAASFLRPRGWARVPLPDPRAQPLPRGQPQPRRAGVFSRERARDDRERPREAELGPRLREVPAGLCSRVEGRVLYFGGSVREWESFFFLMEKRRGARVSGRKKTTKKWRQGRVAIVEVGLAMSLFRLSNQLLPLQSSRRLICLCKLATGEASFCLCFDGEALLPVVAIDDMQFRSARRASRIGSRVLLLLLSLRVSALKLMAFLT
jgi:hypothetical protein